MGVNPKDLERRYAMKLLEQLTPILLVIGGINVGLGVFGINLVEMLLGGFGMATTVVYSLIGIAAVYHVIQGKVFS